MLGRLFLVFQLLMGSKLSSETASLSSKSFPIMSSSTSAKSFPIVGPESLMSAKAHGTCIKPVMNELRWNVDRKKADEICCFNRHYAEHSGYWLKTSFLKELKEVGKSEEPITFYDSVSGKPLYIAPQGRTWDQFIKESEKHGWPSFRDDEVVWENVRCLANGEAVSVDGTHLGHNLPDKSGNRYCINLVSVAGSGERSSTTGPAGDGL